MELDSLHVTVNVHTRPSEEFNRVARALGYAPTDCGSCEDAWGTKSCEFVLKEEE